MFNFLHRSAPRYPTIRQALAEAGLPSASDPNRLAVLERQGSYAGRRVSFFRAFDPTRAGARGIQIQGFRDLDAHRDLMLGSGHVEREGIVVVSRRPEQDQMLSTREPADRSAHADDERFMFWDAEAARISAAILSRTAAAALRAQSPSSLSVGGVV
jgi:hypothetical protein